jgi:hypothetical protein
LKTQHWRPVGEGTGPVRRGLWGKSECAACFAGATHKYISSICSVVFGGVFRAR